MLIFFEFIFLYSASYVLPNINLDLIIKHTIHSPIIHCTILELVLIIKQPKERFFLTKIFYFIFVYNKYCTPILAHFNFT
nr:MAG TPA: hypothetical protein [Caudoviricetes sp.]